MSANGANGNGDWRYRPVATLPRGVKLLDSTLREGEQTPGVSFTLAQKIEIAQRLDEFGIDYIEAGHPAVSDEIFQATKQIANLGLKAEVVAHSRALKRDIDAVLRTDADWVGIFFSVADKRLEDDLRKNMDQAIALVTDCIQYAKAHGLRVRYTPEDTVRSDFQKVLRVSLAAAEAGADRIGVADTTGYMTPTTMQQFIGRLVEGVNGKTAVGIHCHDDLGMAVANSLAACEAGAQVIDVTVNGLGERTGIAGLAQTAVALRLKYGEGQHYKLDVLPQLSALVEKYSRIPTPIQAPIVGRNAFSHNAGLHVAAVLMNPTHYESIPAELVGRTRRLVVDKMAGRPTVRYRLEALGIVPTDAEIDAVLNYVKRRGINDASDEELRAIYEDVIAMRDIVTRQFAPAPAPNQPIPVPVTPRPEVS
ncbi:MAG TPA: homocitrate synthase [Candidatus Thermoplasmatota archaeon]|nr:homocitrate synthase [Candidatus Thermoplasmatota archaeon]